MTLFEIAEKVGVRVADLSKKSIKDAVMSGRITRKQGGVYGAELRKADKIWTNPIKGAPVAKSLW